MEMTRDSKVFTRTPLPLRCCYALVLGSLVLVSMTTANPPQTDAHVLASSESKGTDDEALRPEAPSGSSQAGGLPVQTDHPSPSPPRPGFVGNHDNTTGSPLLANRDPSPSRHTKAPTFTDPSLPSAGPLSTPPLGPAGSEEWSESSPETPIRRTQEATPAVSGSSPVATRPQVPNPRPLARRAVPTPGLDSAAHSSNPPSRSTRSVATPPGPYSPPTPSIQRDAPGLSVPGRVTSSPQGPVEGASTGHTSPRKGGESLLNESLPVDPTGGSKASDHPPAGDSTLSDAAQGIHLFLNPPDLPAPSLGPIARPHATSRAAPEPTMTPADEFYPTHTMEDDWGSGDYLETMSFMGPEGDDFTMATSLPMDMYDHEDWSNEAYDTSFPSRVVPPLSSLRISVSHASTAAYGRALRSAAPVTHRPSQGRPAPVTPRGASDEGLDLDWADVYTVEPTEILLPDMNSLEYYTTLLAKENASVAQRNLTSSGPVPLPSLVTPHIVPTASWPPASAGLVPSASATQPAASGMEDSSWDESGSGSPNFTATGNTGAARPVLNASGPVLEPSVVPTPSMMIPTSLWGDRVSAAPTPLPGETSSSASVHPTASQRPGSEWIVSSTSVETFLHPTVSVTTHATPALGVVSLSPAGTSSPPPTEQGAPSEAATTVAPHRRRTTAKNSELASTSSPDKTTTLTTTTGGPLAVTSKTPLSTMPRYLCNITKLETYLVKVDLPKGSTVGYAKALIREVLKGEFNRNVELQVLKTPSDFVFHALSGSVVYTAISVINVIRQSARISSAGLAAMPVVTVPDHKFQVHSVLQFVPSHVDVRICSFSERVERGLTMAYAEVRRRSNESTHFSVHILNITTSAPRAQRQQRAPVDITFAMREGRGGVGYLWGSDVSAHLRLLNMVEFSFYLGFPVLQIAEPFHYPELNVTQLLRASWVRTVLLGVMDQRVNERTFQAKMERRLAQLLGEVLGLARRWKRATSVGNNSIQIVQTTRLEGSDFPLEMVYFVEGPSGERVPALTTSNMLNQLDVQRAAIVLGYRVQGVLAQPVEKLEAPPSETQSNNMWIIVGVVVPLLVVVFIIIILYWKLCRTDKLEFQPDAMATVQQRQKSTKFLLERIPLTQSREATELYEEEQEEEEEEEEEELQAPSVKGFDFAKLHLGQHSKDDIMVIQEPAPLPVPVKEVTPSENGDVPTPKSKTSSTKASRAARRRGRISPSDGDSLASDPSSGRESTEENLRAPVAPVDGKQARKNAKNGKNKIGPPPVNETDEQLSSASIFEHVDRMTRSGDGTRRVANKIQLIAMQPMPAPPQHSPAVTERVSDSAKINKEIQVALRHKSEIEHHRNKIRLRAKRRGHYDFPAMDDIMDTFGDLKDPDQIYQKAQMQIDKILDPDAHVPSIFMEPRKSGRGKRSPKQRKKMQMNGTVVEDKDRLITTDSDGTYRKYPGVNNVAYVSDPDQLPEIRSPSPSDDVFLAPGSPPPGPAPPPPPYVPPQPSIEEARQQMHSLLDDAFALVSPSSQGSTPGINLPGASPPARTPRGPPSGQWGSSHPSAPALSPFSARYAELGMSPPSVQSLLQRQGLGSGYLPPAEPGRGEQLQPEALYSNRSPYPEDLPSSARPRPVGGTAGAQLHHLTQVGLSSQIGAYPGAARVSSGQTGSSVWGPYRTDEDFSRSAPVRDNVLGSPDSSAPSLLQMSRPALREPSAPPAHLDTPGLRYPSAPLEGNSPPSHSSASLIKAIREELMRLSQKQASVPNYHG